MAGGEKPWFESIVLEDLASKYCNKGIVKSVNEVLLLKLSDKPSDKPKAPLRSS